MCPQGFSEADQIMRCDTALGGVTLAAGAGGLRGLWFDGQKHFPELPVRAPTPRHPLLDETVRQLREYFAGKRRIFDIALDLSHGTAFQQSVWRALLVLPFGATTSYGALAASLGRSSAVRAVAAAVGRNPISVIVPCHRVLGSDGSLTGYAGGLDRKRMLLALEQP